MAFEDQVVAIYAGTRGYLDKLAVSDILPFQDGLVAHMKSSHGGIMADIVAKGAISDETDKSMKDILSKYLAEFNA